MRFLILFQFVQRLHCSIGVVQLLYHLLPFVIVLVIVQYTLSGFDFLLVNRPVIFTPFDYDEYINSINKLYFDYSEVTPGPKCYNWGEVIQQLENYLKIIAGDSEDKYIKQRIEIRDRFNEFDSNESCKRVFDAFF